MSKKIAELQKKRAASAEAAKAITAKAQAENRNKTPEELVQWNNHKSEVEELTAEIDTLVEEERMDAGIAAQGVQEQRQSSEDKEAKKYDLTKAMRSFLDHKPLDGFEAEMQQEGVEQMRKLGRTAEGIVIPDQVKRSFTAAAHGANHFEKVENFDASAVEGGILERLGITVYNGATASIGLNFGKGTNAGIYAEGAAVPEGTYTQKRATLTPKRIQGWNQFSRSYLAQTATTPDFLMQMEAAIQKAVSTDLMTKITGAAEMTLTGRDSAATAAVLVWADLAKLKAGVEIDELVNARFVTGKEFYHELEAIKKDAGSGRFFMENGIMSGEQVVNAGSKLPPKAEVTGTSPEPAKHKLVYGDFRQAYAAYFSGATEILVDPYTASNTGEVKITFLRMGDTAVNPYAFRSIQNIKI